MTKTEDFNRRMAPLRDELKDIASRMTRNDDRAEDVVQEVMIKLWSMRASLGEQDNVKALATAIMRNKLNDLWRHDKLEQGKIATAGPIADERNKTELRDEVNLVKIIVAHLPSLQQQIFRMREIEGYTTDEICQITGCNAESLRQNLSRARRKIREDYIKLTTERIKHKEE